MSGRGSGRRNGAKRGRVEAHLALSVGDLRRGGVLRLAAFGRLTWGTPEQLLGAMRFRTTESEIELSYCVGDGAAESISEHISLARVRADFGGVRTYFRCPGEGCNRRVEALYFARERFRCRTCHGLADASQCEGPYLRLVRRANKARARLSYPTWQPCALVPVVCLEGMWWYRFSDLQYRLYTSRVPRCERALGVRGPDHGETGTRIARLGALVAKVVSKRTSPQEGPRACV